MTYKGRSSCLGSTIYTNSNSCESGNKIVKQNIKFPSGVGGIWAYCEITQPTYQCTPDMDIYIFI